VSDYVPSRSDVVCHECERLAGDARNDCMKDWLARWCGCHAMLFLSYLQRTKASYYMSAERSVTVALVVHIRTRHMSKELPVE
jgi:hypothetical protein